MSEETENINELSDEFLNIIASIDTMYYELITKIKETFPQCAEIDFSLMNLKQSNFWIQDFINKLTSEKLEYDND